MKKVFRTRRSKKHVFINIKIFKIGSPDGIRTRKSLILSQMPMPIRLRGQLLYSMSIKFTFDINIIIKNIQK